jgi:hypothetical protein
MIVAGPGDAGEQQRAIIDSPGDALVAAVLYYIDEVANLSAARARRGR